MAWEQSLPMQPEFLAVGQLRRPHGVRGEILMSVWTEYPERIVPGASLYVGESHTPVHVRSVRWHRDDMLIAFEGYLTCEAVGLFRNQILMVRTADLPPLDEGEYYLHQLIGMVVIDDQAGTTLGVITEILETGANDVYIVRNESGSEILLPAIDPVILDIDPGKRVVRVHILPGLLSENE
jgi:16S rRNA processing protein RimM